MGGLSKSAGEVVYENGFMPVSHADFTTCFRDCVTDNRFTALQDQPSPVSVHVDLSGFAQLIWRWFIDLLGEVGNAILIAIANTAHAAAQAIWDAVWHFQRRARIAWSRPFSPDSIPAG